MKSVCAMARQQGMARSDFQRRYEDVHAPLAIRHLPFLGYARNHVCGDEELGFDTISEFVIRDPEEMASLLAGEAGAIMRMDEACFMDKSREAPAGAESFILSDGLKATPEGRRTAVLIGGGSSISDHDGVSEWARGVARYLEGVSIDWLSPWGQPHFPADAIVWIAGWTDDLPVLPQGARRVRVAYHETPVADMSAAFCKGTE